MPEAFKKVELGDLAELIMGQSPPSQFVHEGQDQGIPFLQGNAEFGDIFPEPKYSCDHPARTCAQNDVLISVRAPVGELNLADQPYCIGRGLGAIRFKNIPSTLGAKLLAKYSSQLHAVAQGTTFQAIGRPELSRLQLLLPPRREWHLIDEILRLLDTQIHKTESLIAKLVDIRQGLLTDLLTRGIDHNGQLRPRPDQAPQLYKDSSLGKIPKEWTTPRLGELMQKHDGLVQTGPFGSQLHADEYVHHGVPVVMPQDMRAIEVSVEKIAQITESRARDLARHRTQSNDVLFSRRGDLSRCCVMTIANQGWVCGTGCLLVRLPKSILSGYWLAHIYKQPAVQSQVYGMAVGSTMVNLNSGILASVTIALPPTEEQIEFEKRVKALSERIDSEVETVEKLKTEKSGLMDDLLTGQVRVTPLLGAAGP